MAGFFYVLNALGSRTVGGALTKQTGTFAALGAASIYATVALAVTDGAAAGDIICVSDANAESTSNLAIAGPSSGDFLQIICVDDANCDQSAIDASVTFDGATTDIILSGRLDIYGVHFKAGDDVRSGSSNAMVKMEECTMETAGSIDVALFLFNDGAIFHGKNITFIVGDTGGIPINIQSAANLILWGGSVDATTKPVSFFKDGFVSGGGIVELNGFDLRNVTTYILENIGGSTADDLIDITLNGCPVASGITAFFEETFVNYNHRFSAFNSAATSAAAEYQFHIEGYGGFVDDSDDTGIHRDETTAFPSGTKVSAHCVTNSSASLAAPFYFDLPSLFAKLSNASTDTIRIYLASTTALDDTDVWIELLYPDGTNKHVYNQITTRNTDRLAVASSGTTLTTDSGSTWKDGGSDLAGFNEYFIDLDTSVDVGANSVPLIRIYVAIPSVTIYFDPVPDTVA